MGEEIDESRKCPKHGEKEILFCREAGCQKLICPLCLSEAHLGHKVVAIKDETKDVLAKLVKNIEITNERLNKKIRKVEAVSQDVIKKTEANLLQITTDKDKVIQELEKKKERMIREYYDMLRKARAENNKLNEASRNDLTAMKDNMELLNSIKQSIEEEDNTYEDAMKKLDTARGVTENIELLPQMKKYQYSEYEPGKGNIVGKLVKKEKSIILEREQENQVGKLIKKEKLVLRRTRELRGQG